MAATLDRRKAYEMAQARERAMQEKGEIDASKGGWSGGSANADTGAANYGGSLLGGGGYKAGGGSFMNFGLPNALSGLNKTDRSLVEIGAKLGKNYGMGTPLGIVAAGMSTGALQEVPNRALAQQRIEGERGTFQDVDDRIRSFARGVPVIGGGMDEVAANLNTGFGMLSDYDQELAYQRQRDVDYDARHPYQSAAGQVIGAVGGTIAGARFLPKSVPFPKTMPGKITAGIGVGGTLGGVETFTRGEGGFGERVTAMPVGAGIGAGIGAFGPVFGKAIGAGVNALTRKYGPYPTIQQMKDATKAYYDRAKKAGLVFNPESYGKTVDEISTAGREFGIGGNLSEVTDDLFGHATRLINKLEKTKGRAPTLAEVEEAKRVASAIADQEGAEGGAGKMIAAKLRSLIDDATPDDFIEGNVREGLENIQAGRLSHSRMERTKTLNRAVYEARNPVDTNYTTAGFSTALKQKFREIAESDEFQYWPPEEQAAVLAVVRSTPGEKGLRALGKFGYGGTFGNMFSGSTSALAPQIGIPFSLLTTASRYGGARAGINNARIAEALVKTGQRPKPTQSSIAARKIAEALMYGGSGRAGYEAQRLYFGGPR